MRYAKRVVMKDQSDQDIMTGYRDRVHRYEVEVAQESFCRYFPAKHGNPWCSSDILEALADFGLKVMSPTQSKDQPMEMQRRRPKVKDGESAKVQEERSQSEGKESLQVVPVTPNGGEIVGNGGSQGSGDAKDGSSLAIQQYVTPQHPQGPPVEYGPRNLEPLFSEQQLQEVEDLRAKAPLLNPQVPEAVSEVAITPVPRPVMNPGPCSPGMPVMSGGGIGFGAGMDPRMIEEERMRLKFILDRERGMMQSMMRQVQEENMRLRMQLMEEREGKYSTPPEKPIEDVRKTKEVASLRKPAIRSGRKEDGPERQQEKQDEGQGLRKETVGEAQEGFVLLNRDGQQGETVGQTERLEEMSEDQKTETSSSSEESEEARDERKHHESPAESGRDKTVEVMLKLMQGMQKMQKQLMGQQTKRAKNGRDEDREEEHIRANVEIHKLPEWNIDSAPVDFQDWMMVIHPQLCDMSESSAEWWSQMTAAARDWYQRHQSLKPLEKLQHEVKTPQELLKKKWARLEKRVSNMLLQSIPESQKEEVISTKNLSVLGILTRLMINYQPGGSHEKAAVLAALESPNEATTVGEAISGLRRWMRWKRRATDISVSMPDPTVMLRGLDRLVNKVLASHPSLQFRVNLTRTHLMVDAVPTMKGIEQLAECLLAEFDQLSYSKRKQDKAAPAVRMKKLEEGKEKGGRDGGSKKGDDSKPAPCRFFHTEQGCKRGKACKWSHEVKDDQRRCWTCGATTHMSPQCPTKDNQQPTSTKKVAKTECERAPKKADEEDASSEKAAVCPSEDMKTLLEEAGKMLKGMTNGGSPRGSEDSGEAKIRSLQRQLDELKGQGAVRVLRLSRIQATEGGLGLLDSGATHALRPQRPGEDLGRYLEVKITLAGGQETKMRMSPGGILVAPDAKTEPILPLGALISELGCSIQWTGECLTIQHPQQGRIPARLHGGCPMVDKATALRLIAELEKVGEKKKMRSMQGDEEALMSWMRRVVDDHPAFQGVPQHLKDKLVVSPQSSAIAGNRKLRKLWRREGGVILFLYSGKSEGFHMKRAAKDLGFDVRKLIEVDIQNGSQWDMVSGELYAELVLMACEGQIGAVVASPNCRTRSRLRHVEVPSLPAPARAWGGGEWGKESLNSTEAAKCYEDDVMMLRSIMLYIIAEEMRKAGGESRPTSILLEHPGEPKDLPEVVSWWRTPQWKALKEAYGLEEIDVDQGELGGKGKKATTLGGNVDVQLPPRCPKKMEGRKIEGKTPQQLVEESRQLSRWAPLMMAAITEAVFKERGQVPKPRVRSWRTHILQGHTPFRKDCAVCQQASGRDKAHKREKLPPRSGVLSLDTAGPLIKAPDLGRGTAKFILVASFTWPSASPEELQKAEDEEDLKECPQIDDWAEIEREREIQEDGKARRGRPRLEDIEARDQKEREAVEEQPEQIEDQKAPAEEEEEDLEAYRQTHVGHQKDDECDSPSLGDDPEDEEKEEEKEEVHMAVHRMAVPMASRRSEEVLKHIIDFYLMLKADGYEVRQIHSDRAAEFISPKLERWCRERDILQTWSAGAEPQSNGRAERTVQEIKARVRRLLHAAQVGPEWWPVAVRNVNERLRRERMKVNWNGQKFEEIPAFMQEVTVKKRFWRTKELEPGREVVKYLSPTWLHHGHWVLRHDGTKMLARAVFKRMTEPVDDQAWIALEEALTPVDLRRRLRGKVLVRKVEGSRKDDKPHDLDQSDRAKEKHLERIIQEEMVHVLHDEMEVAQQVLDATKALQGMRATEEDEILQTKIVSPQEVKKNAEAWRDAIEAELKSLMDTKRALRVVPPEEARQLTQDQGLLAVPAKVVFTIQPDGANPRGKKKCRIVACGNYAPEAEMDCFAAGTDAATLRLSLAMASKKAWHGANLDVKTAFLNAPMTKPHVDSEEEEGLGKILLRPPPILVSLGHVAKDQFWEVLKAMYGFRQSPRLWSDYRDDSMRKMRTSTLQLVQMETEPSAWLMKSQHDEETHGIILTYVDDVLIISTQEVVKEWVELIRSTWETSSPEWVNPDEPTRFLGMELKRSEEGVWMASQKNYTLDVLRKNVKKTPWPKKKTPISKDEAESGGEDQGQDEEEVPVSRTPEEVKEAQRVVGELIWLVTRCRPDLMYATTKMAAWSTRNPKKVLDMAVQVWGYLAGTLSTTLQLKGPTDTNDMEVYTDASYGEDAHGCVVVKWGEAAILWRSARQALQTTSTAEAELVEIMEGATMAESVRVVIEEMCGAKIRCWQYTDSASALSIVSGDSASWRTRHLRKRARFLRWKAMRGDVVMRHQPGSEMVADIGTKALASVRLKELKKMLGLMEEERDEASDFCEAKKGTGSCRQQGPAVDTAQAERLVKVLMVMALVQRAKGKEEEEEDQQVLGGIMLLYTILVMMVTVIGQLVWRRWSRGHHRPLTQHESSATNEGVEEEAPLPALQRRAQQACSSIANPISERTTGQQAGTNQSNPIARATSQPESQPVGVRSSDSRGSPEDTGCSQATGMAMSVMSQKEERSSGHQAQSRSEKIALNTVLDDYEDDEFGFNTFCTIIEEARCKIRNSRTHTVFQSFKYADTEDLGGLDTERVMKLLQNLNLAFEKDSVERHTVEAMVRDCNTDPTTGLIGLSEVEFLVSAVREFMVQSKRRRERELKVEYQLPDAIFKQFRSQLIRFHRSFQELDNDNSGKLDPHEAMNLLSHFGCITSGMPLEQKLRAQALVSRYLGESEEHLLSFDRFLCVVQDLRLIGMEEKVEIVQSHFNQYDRDQSGQLTIKEICQILMDLKIQPRSLSEQGSRNRGDGSAH
eukprot:s2720_g4.t3